MIYAYASRLNQAVQGEGRCHSVFHHVINFEFNGHPLISIIEEGYPAQPYGLILQSSDFKQLKQHVKQEDACHKNGHLFIFGNVRVLETGFYDSDLSILVQDTRRSTSLMLEWVKTYFVRMGIRNELYHRVIESKSTDSTIEYGLSKLRDLSFKVSDFAYCLGYGAGLTPSSDDMCVGYFATLQGMRITTPEYCASLHQWIVEIGDHYTNKISLKFIQCILINQVEEDVAECLNALFNLPHEVFVQCADALMMHGSSSGSDVLLGIYLALQAIQRSQNG
jgi:hypothetical protein